MRKVVRFLTGWLRWTPVATAPDRIRRVLQRITRQARRELRAVAQAAPQNATDVRSALFAATPLIVSDYSPGAATLALDWYEQIREEVAPQRLYTPTPRLRTTDEDVAAIVARTTEALHEIEQGLLAELEVATTESLRLLESEVQKEIVAGFRDTITENTKDDPESVGWRRFARPEACKFCLMLAARGAVYTEATARFAAHGAEMRGGRKGGDCMCIAGPEFGGKETWAEATPMQYLASRRQRSAADRARLREYLNQHFPDASG